MYDSHADLFEEELHDLTMLAERVLGREIGSILKGNELLYARVISILLEKDDDIKRRFRQVLRNENYLGDYHGELTRQIVEGIKTC